MIDKIKKQKSNDVTKHGFLEMRTATYTERVRLMTITKWIITDEEQKEYTRALTEDLALLRVKAGISQEDLANMIGVSRQTYSAIECRRKEMSWQNYLSLVLFFDYNRSTREMFRGMASYPAKIIYRINDGKSLEENPLGQTTGDLNSILQELDEQALHALKTMLLVEYARCKNIPGDVVVKAFEGMDLRGASPDAAAETALRNIRKRKNRI